MILILLCAITILLVPLAMMKGSPQGLKNKNTTQSETQNKEEKPTPSTTTTPQKEETISVFRTINNKAENITMFEYVCGSVAAEMPLAYNEEAIKAQAVACYTNALRLKLANAKGNEDISDNTAVHQGYIDKAQRKEKWGKDFEKYEKKLENAIKEVENKAIYYDNKLCVAAFCAISNGQTEDAQNLWSTAVPYLKSVNSEGDKLSPGYASTVSYSRENFLKIAEKSDVKISGIKSLDNIIKINEKSSTGTVLSCAINGKSFTGEQVRKMFSLRSPTFTVKATAEVVTFSVYGYGHGIGMSQYGANYFAQEGYTYDKILKHYYNDIEIK